MNQVKYSFLFILSILILTACGGENKAQAQARLNVKSFKTAIAKTGIQLVDVRTPNEYKYGHIKGAKLINWYDNSFASKVAKLDKNKPVYLYCKGGVRSYRAASKLKQMGFKKVYDLQGGMDSWIRSGYSVVK